MPKQQKQSFAALPRMLIKFIGVIVPRRYRARWQQEWQAELEYRVKKPLKTVRDVILGLGRLGGHLNRKGDGLPGWITLWRGWQYLQTLVEGALIARNLNLKPG